jgi:hypothetical protein
MSLICSGKNIKIRGQRTWWVILIIQGRYNTSGQLSNLPYVIHKKTIVFLIYILLLEYVLNITFTFSLKSFIIQITHEHLDYG